MHINHTAYRRAASFERVPLKQDALNGCDTGFKRQRTVRFDIKYPVGMHRPVTSKGWPQPISISPEEYMANWKMGMLANCNC